MSSPPQLPPWVTPEYLAEDARAGPRVGIIVVHVVAFAVVFLRFYARGFLLKSVGIDDYLMGAAAVVLVGVWFLCLRVLELGAGLHTFAFTPAMLVPFLKHLVALQLVYHADLWLVRVSGLAFYARVCNNAPAFRFHMWIAFTFVTAVFIAQFLILALQCIPLKALWGDGTGKCLPIRATFISTAAMTIICDALILLIPFRVVWGLQTDLKRKLILAFVLLFGIFAVATSILRIINMLPAVNGTDPFWHYANIAAWSAAEVCSAVIALSVPALKPLFGSCFGGDTRKSSKGYQAYDAAKSSAHRKSGNKGSSHALKSFGSSKPSHAPLSTTSEENLWSGKVINSIRTDNNSEDHSYMKGITKTMEVQIKRHGDQAQQRGPPRPWCLTSSPTIQH